MDLDNKTVVLVMGGSQGAAVIFDSLLTLLGQEKVDASFQFFILLGTKNAHYQEKFALFTNVMTYKFISNQDELA